MDVQPEDAEPKFYTHFDCWNADGDPNKPTWHWRSNEAEHFVQKLLADWANEIGCPDLGLEWIHFKRLSGDAFFDRVGEHFVRAGFCVYNGEESFEVYDPDDCPSLGAEETLAVACDLLKQTVHNLMADKLRESVKGFLQSVGETDEAVEVARNSPE